MKKLFGLMMACSMIFCFAVSAFAAEPAVNSITYVVMEAKSGKVLASKGANTKKYPASITKILTCGIALENGSPEDKHTMTYKATHSIEPGSTHIALTEEEVVTVNDLLNATMIESANDAANGLAEYIAGDIDDFPALMNEKCAEIGAVNSHFMNAHGLHHKEHYTTAYDMALITRWAIGIDGFREIFGAEEYSVPPTNKQPVQRNIGTHHMMLVNSKFYYEGTKGGKLGWTPEARHTMVTLAERNGMELICVVMDTRTQYEKFNDSIALLDYCFENFTVSSIKVKQFADKVIPVYDGDDTLVSEVFVPEQEFFVAHSPEIAKADITARLQAPESFSLDEDIAVKISFCDKEGNVLALLDAEWESRDVEPAPEAEEEEIEGAAVAAPIEREPRVPFAVNWLIAVPVVILVLFGVLMLIRAHNLRVLEQRRLKRMRMKQEMLDRQLRQSMQLTERGEPVMTISFGDNKKPNREQGRKKSSKKRFGRAGRKNP